MSASSGAAGPPIRAGALLAVASATLFGLSTPFVRIFGQDERPLMVAGLLYSGAALSAMAPAVRRGEEAPLGARDVPRLVSVALCGAVIAPACLAWGLARTSAVLGSLLLASEAIFTVLLARIVYREPIGTRVVAALLCIGFGSSFLVKGAGTLSSASALGSGAVVMASLAWAADNLLTRPLADKDPRHVVVAKSVLGAALSFACVANAPFPAPRAALGLVATGALGYGVSLRLYLFAQRRIGAGRTGSIFASAPFIGAVAAWCAGDATAGWSTLVAGLLVATGLYLHVTERHGHEHVHAAMDHDHAHRHDDGHHGHVHDPPVVGEHSHPHHHDAERHEHPHGPDIHHQHAHR